VAKSYSHCYVAFDGLRNRRNHNHDNDDGNGNI